jgi:isoleucyl-tRNA synthetase
MSVDPAHEPFSPSAYPDVPQQPDFSAIEEDVLERWAKDRTFETSISQRDGAEEFVFYDGPPFANGTPHYGHLLTSFVKDTVPRYQTMRGNKVDRRFGWDCHGLPVEMEAERLLGFSGKAAIVDYGVDRFNDYCRTSVMKYTGEWEGTVTRAARWVDFDNDYKTMDLPYMESVMWAFKTLHEKGLMYEGHRVLPYCWECETPLSNFETRLDDAYRDRNDPALTVAFTLEDGRKLLVWTTTPWTLPSNLAIAVGADIDYSVYTFASGDNGTGGSDEYIIGAATVDKYKKQLENATLVDTVKGSTLVGLSYTPLFPYFAGHANAFRILAGDFVSTTDGTGSVHMAPAFGEDDQRACAEAGIEMVVPVDAQGKFTSEVPDFQGLQVFEANEPIAAVLKERGVLVKKESYTHSYPHCWRTDTPLIYKAVSSWFVAVTKFRDRMVELNQDINWIPGHVRDGRFGKWIADARDWSISRNRFWGSPIPVWKSDDPAYPRVDVYGSLDELERDFGVRPTDLHRPAIDLLTRPNPDDPTGKSTMRRVEDVLDCWFESGSMPYAQVHYPFENKEWFDSHFPGDFIVEYQPQTRGWFYTLHVLGTALFDRAPFKTCIAHGNVLGNDGRKMSKRLRNYPDLEEIFSSLGADAVRWTLLSSPVLRGGETLAEKKSIVESSRQVLIPIWNAWYFLSLYGNSDGIRGRWRTDQQGALDRYILAKTAELRDNVTAALDEYDLFAACQAITTSIDALNNWWVRRSRDRFWRAVGPDAVDADKQDAYDTLHTVLASVCRIAAPLLPMLAERIYTDLTGEPSVHLTDWLDVDELPHDPSLVAAMDLVRDICSEVLSIRKAQGLRVRLPLAKITVGVPDPDSLRPFVELIADEVNVKHVELTPDIASLGSNVLAVDPRVVGPRVGGKVQQVLGAARKNEWTDNGDGTVTCADVALDASEFTLAFKPKDEDAGRALPGNVGVVVLDTHVTDELAHEGVARDIVRLVQGARRDAGLHISDHIQLVIDAGDVRHAVDTHRTYIAGQTLASTLVLAPEGSDLASAELFEAEGDVEGTTVRVRLRRAI